MVDHTELELKALRGKQYSKGYNGGQLFPYNIEQEITSIPDNLDWRLYGAVTPVKGLYLIFLKKIVQYFKPIKIFLIK